MLVKGALLPAPPDDLPTTDSYLARWPRSAPAFQREVDACRALTLAEVSVATGGGPKASAALLKARVALAVARRAYRRAVEDDKVDQRVKLGVAWRDKHGTPDGGISSKNAGATGTAIIKGRPPKTTLPPAHRTPLP